VGSSSSSAQAIFTLAENLREMQIESWVGELDISDVREGQEARFTLDSLPGRVYSGVVESKRLLPQTKDNVVSYNVIVKVENLDGSLLPGMTCAVEFIQERRESVLVAPNAALRYTPTTLSEEEIAERIAAASPSAGSGDAAGARRAPAAESAAGGASGRASTARSTAPSTPSGIAGLVMGAAPGLGGTGGGTRAARTPGTGTGAGSTGSARAAVTAAVTKTMWALDDSGRLTAVPVRAGVSDGSRTAIEPVNPAQDLEGLRIILREKVTK